MSTTVVDDRIVEMRFDNKDFESNVQTTLSTLDKLKQSLNLNGAAKGLENIGDASKNCNMSYLSSAVETVGSKFSALEVMGVTALANITNSAINAGKRLVSAFTIDPIKTGFAEYETQINAVQTILANTSSKGTTLEQVNEALDELNHYADKTIYNFTEMTRNIGTFTAAGVDLDTSVSAIQGIANVAAVSGSTSQQASTAMYQLSQALASGTVKLQDWNSVVNAGMGGEVFQNALKETARVHGIAIDDMIKDEGSFRETLKSGWLSADILTETLKKFTTSGVNEYLAQNSKLSEKRIEKMREEAVASEDQDKAFKNMAKTISKSSKLSEEQIYQLISMSQTAEDAATKVKTFTQLMDTLSEAVQSGWTQTWEIVIGDFQEAKGLFTGISNTLSDIINRSADARNKVLAQWKELGGRTALIDGLKNIFEGLVSIVRPVSEAFRDIFPPMTAERLVRITETFRDFTMRLIASENTTNNLKRTFKGVFAIINVGLQPIKLLVRAFSDLIGFVLPAGGGIAGLTAYFGDFLVKVNDFIVASGIINKSYALLKKILGPVLKEVRAYASWVTDLVSAYIDWAIQNDIVTRGLKKMVSYLRKGAQLIEGWFDYFWNLPSVQKVVNALTSRFERFESSLSFDNLRSKGLKAFEKFKEVLKDLRTEITFEKVKAYLGSFVKYLKKELDKGRNYISDFAKDVGINLANITNFLKDNVGSIVAILSGFGIIFAARKLKAMFDKVTSPIEAIVEVIEKVGKLIDAQAKKTNAEALLKTAEAIAVLAGSLVLISKIDSTRLWPALGALGLLAAGLIAFSAALKYVGGGSRFSISMVGIGAGIALLAASVKMLAEMNTGGEGTLGVGGALLVLAGLGAGLVLFSAILSKYAPILSANALFLVAFAISLRTLVKALNELSQLKIKGGAKGILKTLGIIAAIMGILGGAGFLVGGASIGSALTVLAFVIALKAIIKVLQDFSELDVTNIKKNFDQLVDLFKAMIIVVGLISLAGPNAMGAGIALIGVSVALWSMVGVIYVLGKLNPADVRNGTAAISGLIIAMALLVGATSLAGPNAIKAGVMLLTMAGALFALSLCITILSKLDPSGVATGVIAISTLIVAFAGMIKMTQFAQDITSSLIVMAVTIGLLAVAIGALSMIDPARLAIATGCMSAVMGMFSLMMYSTKAVDPKALVTIAIMGAIMAGLAIILKLMSDLPVEQTLGTATALSELILALSASCFLLSLAGKAGSAGFVGIGVLASLIAAMGALLVGIGALVENVPKVEEFLDKGIPVVEKIGHAIGSFFGNIAGGFLDGATENLPGIGKKLSDFMTNGQAFFDGVSEIDPNAAAGAKAAAEAIIELTKASVLDGIANFFMGYDVTTSFSKFGKCLVEFGGYLSEYSEAVSGVDAGMISKSAEAAKSMTEVAKTIPNDGGLVGLFAGNNNIAKFGDDLVAFGTTLSDFVNSVSGIKSNAATYAVNAAKAVSELASNLPNSGGLVSLFTGDNDIKGFGAKLKSFGEAMSGFASSISGISASAVAKASSVTKMFSALASSLPRSGGLFGVLMGDNSFGRFGHNLKQFGHAMKDYADTVGEIDTAKLSSTTKAMGGVGQNWVSNFSDSMSRSSIKFESVGRKMIDALTKGAVSRKPNCISAMRTIINAVLISARRKVSDFSKVGHYAMTGFARGMRNSTYIVKAAAASAAKEALEAASKKLSIGSPSKEFEKVGMWSDKGLANGLVKFAGLVKDAGQNVGDVALKSTKNALNNLAGVVTDGIDVNPTITPVLDLSNVRSGANAISGLLSGNRSLGTFGNVGAISNMMRENQNGDSNAEVVAAIRGLRRDIADMPRNSYNINGITYDDGSNITEAVRTLVRAAKVERRA